MRDRISEGMETTFKIRRAEAKDAAAVLDLMQQVKAEMEHPDWYVEDDLPWIRAHISEAGFIMLAESGEGETAGYFVVDFPAKRRESFAESGAEETASQADPNPNLGKEIGLSGADLALVAHMDSAAVARRFRGFHLQSRLLEAVEQELSHYPEMHYLCTVHPDNHASLHTMQRHGYRIAATKEKYGGLLRHVLYKKEKTACDPDEKAPESAEKPSADPAGKSRPRILVSACLLGVNCRYNGGGEVCAEVKKLMEHAELIPVCPEILGGLATPRDPAERIGERVVTKTGTDVTGQYRRGAMETLKLAKLYGCRCAVLKERSPSCGSGRIYDGTHTRTLIPGDGVTAELLKSHGVEVFGESTVSRITI